MRSQGAVVVLDGPRPRAHQGHSYFAHATGWPWLVAVGRAADDCAAPLNPAELQAVATLESEGVRFAPGGIRPGASGHEVTFIHPKGNEAHPIGGGGVLIELVQAPPEVSPLAARR